jgi:hypothetical protein
MIEQTREAAVALSEDFLVLQDIHEKAETRPVDLRHASAILRRWLVEEQLSRVGNPRVGRLHIMTIDNNPIYREARRGDIVSFVSGGAMIHGFYLACGMMKNGRRPLELADYHPDNLETLRLDTFLKQRVIYYQEDWFTRQQIIKFIANADHGVHGHGPREEWEKRLSQFRQEISVSLIDGPDGKPMPSVVWQIGSQAAEISLDHYDPRRVNGVLLEILSTIKFLVKSPEVVSLIKCIQEEIA